MITLSILVSMLGEPVLDGLATYYNGPGPYTRGGNAFVLNAPICSVDDSEWELLRGKTLLIVSDDGHMATLRVDDTGWLYNAGKFYRSSYSRYFVPASDSVAHPDAWPIVVDIPERTFEAIFGDLETRHVWAWIVPDTRPADVGYMAPSVQSVTVTYAALGD